MSEQNQIVDLAYKTYGDPHLPPIILLMGLGTPAAAWPRQIIADLVLSGLYVIVPVDWWLIAICALPRYRPSSQLATPRTR